MTGRAGNRASSPMFQGLLRPLLPGVPLRFFLQRARPREMLGAWLPARAARRRLCIDGCAGTSLLLSGDLGFLLTRCSRVVLRLGEMPEVLEADTIIQWRALQVAIATPYLPGLARLQACFPGLRITAAGLLVPVSRASPEEVLALCIEEGVRITATSIVYRSGTSSCRELR